MPVLLLLVQLVFISAVMMHKASQQYLLGVQKGVILFMAEIKSIFLCVTTLSVAERAFASALSPQT